MADDPDIALALFARVATLVVASPNLPIDYPEPETDFVPPTDGKYLSAQVFFNRPIYEGLTRGKISQGLLQINVVWPKNKGVVAPLRIARSVIAHFPKALQLASGVKISRQPWTGSPISAPSEVVIPVTIPWSAV